jgi:hypothetical protein
MGPKVNLTAKWQLDAALLSRPVDLTALVSMSKADPIKFTTDNTLERLVASLLNEKNAKKSDHDTKLDVLSILANVAGSSTEANAVVSNALQAVSEWFDEYIATTEVDPGQEPELHKAMVLLLCRCWEYKLKTEDVLELTQGNRRVALCTVVGLLEDGETYSTELKQRQAPTVGKMAQWEHELVCQRYEKPLLLQICRLLRGFTHPGTYFEASKDEIALHGVQRFADEMDILLDITLRVRLVEKLSSALYDCLFEAEEEADRLRYEADPESAFSDDGEGSGFTLLNESDHLAVASVNAFLQNLYFYATENNDEFRNHMLVETLLIPRLLLPYLDRCVMHVKILNSRAEAYKEMLEGDQVADLTLHSPQLVKGMASSLRTLIVASFRAPATQFVMTLLQRMNPTSQILQASTFIKHHEYIFALLCMLNVNMGALDLSKSSQDEKGGPEGSDSLHAHSLLHDLASLFNELDPAAQTRVYKKVVSSGALPISRDTPSYVAVMSVLHGGAAGQLEYVMAGKGDSKGGDEDTENYRDMRGEAKQAHLDRMAVVAARESKADPSSSSSSSSAAAATSDEEPASTMAEEKHADGPRGDVDNNKNSNNNARRRDEEKGADRQERYRLLGALPSLGPRGNEEDVKVALALELPSDLKKAAKQSNGKNSTNEPPSIEAPAGPPGVPKEYLCAINGHVMQDPVRSPEGYYFEKATIELWLSTRGSICPISHEPLTKEDLVEDRDLRNKIKRYHIQQVTRVAANDDDDLYDF